MSSRGRGRGRSSQGWRRDPTAAGSNNNAAPAATAGRHRGPPKRQAAKQQHTAMVLNDEDVLIEFMPYVKGENPEATNIHREYQSSNDETAFLKAARDFIQRNRQPQQNPDKPQQARRPIHIASSSPPPSQSPPTSQPPSTFQLPAIASTMHQIDPATLFSSSRPTENIFHAEHTPDNESNVLPSLFSDRPSDLLFSTPGPLDSMQSIENGLQDSLKGDDPIAQHLSKIWGSSPITPPRGKQHPSPWSSPEHTIGPQPYNLSAEFGANIQSTGAASFVEALPLESSLAASPLRATTNDTAPKAASTPHTTPLRATKSTAPKAASTPNTPPPPRPLPVKRQDPPKRVWAHFDEQPGRIAVDGCNGADSSLVLVLAPRQELTAHWSLPLDYIMQRKRGAGAAGAVDMEAALRNLTVGLFRRGCTENGAQASIIAKQVLGDDNRSYSYGLDPGRKSVSGRIPFYSPRTPGHVIFRLYWDDEPVYTLAMGPTLLVKVTERDFDLSIRFILSNFKGKKSNPTSLSSIHSLAQVLETPLTSPNESAARAIWGSIQEARKVIEACAQEYEKTSSKLSLLEEKVEELKHQVEHEDEKSMSASTDEAADVDKVVSETVLDLRENTRVLMSGRASCERKWRDSQLAFASILKAVVSNPAMNMLLRRDMITKMRIEYELWCPLSEEFAIPSENATLWFDPLRDLTHTITSEDFQLYTQARVKMQLRDLGFEPNTVALDDILFPRNRQSPNQRAMNSDAVSCFNNMSAAMGKYYQELYADEEDVVRLREYVHNRTVKCVEECGAFPRGTRVVIFGSSANGFGSPKSDIDMCLQLPQGVSLSEDDRTGSVAMSKLADYFEESGMNDVDASRLTARIPIVRFFCPNPMSKGSEDEQLIECDLSMHNPLAVLNTSLLRSYAEITPVTRVLASVVKRWAKARDINNPAKHTLSSYGYIIMLLHFLTYHKRSGNGLLTPVAPATGNSQYRKDPAQQAPPVLPNLLWVDPMWPNFPRGTPYRELPSLPRAIKPHPLEEGKSVNSYFYKPVTPNDKAVLQMLFAGQDLSLAILLASFFRYYAYEFDYKRYVVSLHSNATRGIVEREVKAELDGWRNYSAALTIEDPFETSYDIAHVLRGGYYHRIRREFAVAYAKIADAASGRAGSWNKSDMEVMSGQDLIDWICEPVENDRPDT